MRTVTFSDAKVAERINAKFVPVWFNRGRGFHNCELKTEKWIFESTGDAYPTKNICTFFLTPEMKVLYYVSGYYAPEVFLEVLGTAERLQAAVEGVDFARLHREFSGDLSRRIGPRPGVEPKAPLAGCGTQRWRDQEHRHGKACADVLKGAYEYFKRVHDELAREGPVPLDKVQHDYLFGNSFTEEARSEQKSGDGLPRPQTPTGSASQVRTGR